MPAVGGELTALDWRDVLDRWIVDNEPSKRYPIYTRGNVGEVFPEPVTPLTSTNGIVPFAEPGWRDALERFGAFRPDEFDPDNIEIIGVFGGYCFLNVSVSRILGVRTPGLEPQDIDFQLWGEMPGVPPYEPCPGDDDPERTAAIQQTLQLILSTDSLPEQQAEERFLADLRVGRPDLTALSDHELVAHQRALLGGHFRRLFGQHLFVTYCSTVPVGIIQKVCTQVGRPELFLSLIAGLGDVESAAPSSAMWALGRRAARSRSLTRIFEDGAASLHDRLQAAARGGDDDARAFLGELSAFTARYGARGPNEWETRSETWETAPDLALAAIDRMRLAGDDADPASQHARLAAGRASLTDEVLALVEGDAEVHGQLQAALRAAAVFLPGRERSKTNAIKLTHEGRMAWFELGRRMVEAGHFEHAGNYGMLLAEEVDAFVADPASLAPELLQREVAYQALSEVEPPFVFVGAPPPVSLWARRGAPSGDEVGEGETLTGLPGCPGVARGRARVVLTPYDPTAFQPGDVLIAPLTDPSWTPLFVPAAAVVVDVGAPLSHAIIVSRELGIPCAVSVTGATQRIPDGALVEVDGAAGTVTVVSR